MDVQQVAVKISEKSEKSGNSLARLVRIEEKGGSRYESESSSRTSPVAKIFLKNSIRSNRFDHF